LNEYTLQNLLDGPKKKTTLDLKNDGNHADERGKEPKKRQRANLKKILL